MDLAEAELEYEYRIKEIRSKDDELSKFLFSLGCYPGESIIILARKRNSLVLSLKEARYNVDMDLAKMILVE